MAVYITNSTKETEDLGKKIAEELSTKIFALIGELGSGKTTFVKGFAKGLKIKKRVLSPSFVLIRRYLISPRRSNLRAKQTPRMVTRRGSSEVEELGSGKWGSLYHLDLYRLEKPINIKELGLEEIWINPYNIVVIEWAEKIKKVLPKKRMEIYFEHLNKNKRRITIKLFNHDDHLSIQP